MSKFHKVITNFATKCYICTKYTINIGKILWLKFKELAFVHETLTNGLPISAIMFS